MSNALGTGAMPSEGADFYTHAVPDIVQFLPGTVPTDINERNRFLNYSRDPDIPKHRVRWNFLADLPFGKGKPVFGKASGLLNGVIGGWQLAAYGTMTSRWWALPTSNWGTLSQPEIYGTKYPIEDCRSGACIPGYLYYNGYIPANRINSYDANGKPNGVMGVPADYKPAHAPITPIPAEGGNNPLFDTNDVTIPLSTGQQQRVAMDTGLHLGAVST